MMKNNEHDIINGAPIIVTEGAIIMKGLPLDLALFITLLFAGSFGFVLGLVVGIKHF